MKGRPLEIGLNLDRLRKLRSQSKTLLSTCEDDLPQFLSPDGRYFVHLKNDPAPKVSVTSTSTCLMALRLAGYFEAGNLDLAKKAIDAVFNEEWTSGGLPHDNAFTASVVLRAVSLFYPSIVKLDLKHNYKRKRDVDGSQENVSETLAEIIKSDRLQLRDDGGLRVLKYPRSACLTYWFLKALIQFEDPNLLTDLGAVMDWAEEQVTREMAYIRQEDTDRMDIVQLGFSIAILHLLNILKSKGISMIGGKTSARQDTESLGPGTLNSALLLVLQHQEPNGLWRKYAPLFHYPDSGANYCFAFELLEMLLETLHELPAMRSELALTVFEKSITWLADNRIRTGTQGWNSGTPGARQEGVPESWATAAVYMFLVRLNKFLSELIRQSILARYKAENVNESRNPSKWDELLNSPLEIDFEKTALREEILKSIIKPIEDRGCKLLPDKYQGRISALLFGPPGTSKTKTARAIAYRLGWPFVEITPSHFIQEGSQAIEGKAIQIFEDLSDLELAVILFDEMDELLRERDPTIAPEMISRFLTTSMLPKFQKLYEGRKVLFFVATNHRSNFDVAITRPGRFDLALHVAPPSTEHKIEKLTRFHILTDVRPESLDKLKAMMRKYAKQLDYFLFDEFHLLLEALFRDGDPNVMLMSSDAKLDQDFEKLVNDWSKAKIILHAHESKKKKNTYLEDYEKDKSRSTRQ